MATSKKTAVISPQCVACVTCLKPCPRQALNIHKGMRAQVNAAKCVGCGICAKVCPAGVISIQTIVQPAMQASGPVDEAAGQGREVVV